MYVSDTCHLILHTVYSLGCVYMIIHIYIYILYTYIYIYTYLATWLPSYLATYLPTYIQTYIHIDMDTHTYIHTYVRTYMHCIAVHYITLHCITTIQYIQTLHTLHTYMVTYDTVMLCMMCIYIYTYTVAYIYIYMCIAWCMCIYIYIYYIYISTFYIHKCNIHYIHMISVSLNIQIHVFNLYEKHNMYIIHDIMLTMYIYTHKLWDICLQCMIFDRSQVICRYTQCDVPFPPD